MLAFKKNSIHSAENSVVQILQSIQQEIYDLKLKQENTNLRKIIQSDKNKAESAQFIRRNNIEISGIPDIFKDDIFEDRH